MAAWWGVGQLVAGMVFDFLVALSMLTFLRLVCLGIFAELLLRWTGV